jgi:hypothetical protein
MLLKSRQGRKQSEKVQSLVKPGPTSRQATSIIHRLLSTYLLFTDFSRHFPWIRQLTRQCISTSSSTISYIFMPETGQQAVSFYIMLGLPKNLRF